MGIINHSPIAQMPLPIYERREGDLSQQRFEEIIRQIDNDSLKVYLTFIWETGVRPNEARMIEARHYDGRRIVLPIVDSKGKKHNRVIYPRSASCWYCCKCSRVIRIARPCRW